MEYPMSTLITGERSYESLVGVTVHELAHSWFQHLLATNERIIAASCDAAIEAQRAGSLKKVTYMSSSMVFQMRL